MKESKEMGNQVCNNISHLTNGYPIACPFFHFLLPCPFITQPDRLLNTLWLEPMGLKNVIYAGFDDLSGKTQTSCAFKKCKSVWVSLRKVLDHRRNSPLSIYLYIYIFKVIHLFMRFRYSLKKNKNKENSKLWNHGFICWFFSSSLSQKLARGDMQDAVSREMPWWPLCQDRATVQTVPNTGIPGTSAFILTLTLRNFYKLKKKKKPKHQWLKRGAMCKSLLPFWYCMEIKTWQLSLSYII